MTTLLIPLRSYANAHAATFDADRSAGFVNAWGNSFPAEEMPFGRVLLCGGIPFAVEPKGEGEADHIEALGQIIEIGSAVVTRAIAILCFAELGDQRLPLTLIGRFGEKRRLEVTIPYWLTSGEEAAKPSTWRATHLHYAAGYELNHLRPALHAIAVRLPAPFSAVSVELGVNPLVHMLALTLVDREVDRG